MKVLKTAAIIGVGIAGGMIIADVVTGGAVRDAIGDMFGKMRDTGMACADVVSDAAEDIAEVVTDAANDVVETVD